MSTFVSSAGVKCVCLLLAAGLHLCESWLSCADREEDRQSRRVAIRQNAGRSALFLEVSRVSYVLRREGRRPVPGGAENVTTA